MLDKEEKAEAFLWESLLAVMPQIKKLPQSQRSDLYMWVRCTLIQEREEAASNLNIYRFDDQRALEALIQSLPYTPPAEVWQQVLDLKLSQAESELEATHWAFRRQSVNGDILFQNNLFPFKIIRIQRYAYLLLFLQAPTEITQGFSRAFGKTPDIFSGSALQVEDQLWMGWVWFTSPDPAENQYQIQQLKHLWQGGSH